MGQLTLDERLWYHTDGFSAVRQNAIGQDAHQPNASPAKNKADSPLGKQSAKGLCGLAIVGEPSDL